MGQYYKTSKPTYVEDFMYKPPWELAKEVILAKDKAVNDQIAGAAELEKVLNFNYLDFDEEKAIQKQMEYRNKIQDVVNKIQEDPENYAKYKNELITTSKALQADMTTGEIASITGTYAGAERFKKDHEKYKDKEGARYNAGYSSFYENAKKKREEIGYVEPVWQSEQLMESMDFGKRFLDFLKEKKVNRTASASSGTDGRFIYTRQGTNEVLTQEEVRSLMNDAVLSTPGAAEYIDQTKRIKMGDPTEGLIQLADNYTYTKQTASAKQTTDPTYLKALGHSYALDLIAAREESAKNVIAFREQLGLEAGMVEVGTAKQLFGEQLVKGLNRDLAQEGLAPMSQDAFQAIGMPSLFKQGIISTKRHAQVLDSSIKDYEERTNFGGMQFILVPTVDMVYKGKPYKAGKNYLVSGNQAIKSLAKITPGTGKPFYFSDRVNGVSFNAETKDEKGVWQPGNFKIILAKPGSVPGLTSGAAIFDQFEVSRGK